MSRIQLIVSDVDGTLVTSDKLLTESAKKAVEKLHAAEIGFTIVSSRPPFGMRFFFEPLALTLPIGAFNGSSIVDRNMRPVEQHLIPEAAARRSVELLSKAGVDVWVFTNEKWVIQRDDGKYVPHEKKTIQFEPTVTADFSPYLSSACKIVGASADADLLARCEGDVQKALGINASAIRSQKYYLDITPPGHDKGTFVATLSRQLNVPSEAIATIGDMRNDLAMFAKSGMSVAMGNATDDVKQRATDVTTSNEEDGFAGAVQIILDRNAAH